MSSRPRTLAAWSAFAIVFATAGAARADVSSWLSTGVGVARLRWTGTAAHDRVTMPIDLGFGLPPSLPVIVGAGVRSTVYFGDGPDWGAYARVVTRSYVTGDFGLALDGGGWFRSFGIGNSGWQTRLSVGLPWGLFVAGDYAMGTNDARNLDVFVGIDFLRLTVYRLTGEQQWPNVNPAYRP